MSTQSGYSSIPANDPDDGAQQAQQQPSTLINRIKQFIYKTCSKKHHLPVVILSAIVLFILLLVGLVTWLPEIKHKKTIYPIEAPITPGISLSAFKQGLTKCQHIRLGNRARSTNSEKRTFNPRAPRNSQPILLRNAIVWDGQGEILNHVDILMSNGVISQVKQNIQAPAAAKIIDVGGHIVSPGIVDMHTHLGVMSWPDLSGTSDTNEKTDPITPFVRTLDAFNPSDKAIRIVASGGITTALVLPGSGNIIGGEAFAFKLRPTDTLSNQDMLVQNGIDEETEQKWRYMKMACGENPKSYGRTGRMPSTRLGEAYLLRQALAKAKKLVEEQEDWCSAAENLSSAENDIHLDSHFPEDIRLESLTALLRGQVKLNIHCYETHDIEAMLRHAEEFNFNISAFHHALEAYKIPEILKRAQNSITIATFADHWGYKKEAYGASPRAPKYLYEAGIPVALKSDHPVLNSQHMAFEAAKATHYGLPPQEAFKSITSVPATALGLGHRVGSLRPGYDADVVIWDRSPLALGAAPLQVFVDGVPLFDEKPITPVKDGPHLSALTQQKIPQLPRNGLKDFVLANVGSNLVSRSKTVLVLDGKIVCSTEEEECRSTLMQSDLEAIDVQGGYVLPGLIAVGSKIGMVEMPSEGSTGDGVVPSSFSQNPKSVVEAIDGLKLGTRKLEEAYKGGVLTTISSPISRNIVIGVSAAFRTNADSILSNGAIMSPAAALHFQIGHAAKSDSFPTVSSQIAFLRQLFTDNIHANNRYGEAARGELPLIIMVNNKDEIASIVQLKEKVIPKARLAIMGGAEAHLLAPHLAAANIAVILRPYLCTPENFDSSHCLTGAPLTNGTGAHILHRHGVKIGLGVSDDGWARNLAWDAGWLAATSPSEEMRITEIEAIKFVTTNLQEIFGLKEEENEEEQLFSSDFVVWSGSPLDMQSRPLFVHTQENGIQHI
ncbi:amidohydrolase family protein [Mucor ambiguus]|uniref:Amidohydrolase family protein n=1 Tax=Mucor ambiguus TaxID=91626 RepID=A0A0C9MMD3_9FUNG|nr:amidohydrolase family protein [Mucor ambiguus]